MEREKGNAPVMERGKGNAAAEIESLLLGHKQMATGNI